MGLAGIGLEAVLQFGAEEAISAMGRAGSAFNNLHKNAKKVGEGSGKVAGAMGNAAKAALPLAAGVGYGVHAAAEFQSGMAQVSATTGITGADLEKLRLQAIQMGIQTQFSATKSAEAMELMGRKGAHTEDILKGLPGILAAAGASQTDLAQASDIIGYALKQTGKDWSEATNVANVFAIASEKIGTSLPALGNAFSYVGQSATAMGFSFESTTVAVAAMQAAGQKGAKAGTELVHMFTKLTKPTKGAREMMSKWGIQLEDAQGKMYPLSTIVEQFRGKIGGLSGDVEKQAAMTELFGIQGKRAYEVLAGTGKAKLDELTKALENSSGAAEKMAAKRRDNVIGQFNMFMSSMQTMAVEFFGPMLDTIQKFTTTTTNALNDVMFAMEALNSGMPTDEMNAKFGETTTAIAKGLKEAVDTIKQAITDIQEAMANAGDKINEFVPTKTIQRFTKFAALGAVIAAAFVPVVGALAGVGFVLVSVVIPAVEGLVMVFSGLLGILTGPVGIALLAVAALFLVIKRDNESFGDTAIRIWDTVKNAVLDVWTNGIKPFVDGFMGVLLPVWDDLKVAGEDVKTTLLYVFDELFGFMSDKTTQTKTDWFEVGKTIGSIVGAALMTVIEIGAFVIKVFLLASQTIIKIGAFIWDYLVTPFIMVWNLIKQVGTGLLEILTFSKEGMIGGFKRIGLAILDFLLEPLRTVLKTFVRISDLAHMKVPQSLRDFVDKELAPAALLVEKKEKPGVPAKLALGSVAASKAAAAPQVTINQPPAQVKVGDTKVDLHLDGRKVAGVVTKHQVEFGERAGMRLDHWQRKVAQQHGVLPMPTK